MKIRGCRTGLVSLAAFLLAASVAGATTIHVTTTQDPDNGTGQCTAGGTCSLREAINAAHADSSVTRVSVPAGTYKLTDGSGALAIVANITLAGAGARHTIIQQTVTGAGVLGANATATIQGLTITGGHSTAGAGGGINNAGTLTLKNSTVTDNESDGYLDSTCFTPPACPPPTPIAGLGGGIYSGGGSLTVIASTISGNVAAAGNDFGAGAGGGGIFSTSPVTVINSTISGNAAQGRLGSVDGGGIYMGADPQAQLALANVTVAFNQATGNNPQGGNLYLVDAGNSHTAQNSVIANGTATAGSENCGGTTLLSEGYNLEDRDECGLHGTGDKVNTPPKLGPLKNHGGFTDTRALLSGSPAINGGNLSGCKAGPAPIVTDQRLVHRPQGARCDIGAFEFRIVQERGVPFITGKAQVGQRLRCVVPPIESPDGPARVTVLWLRNGLHVATGRLYTVRPSDAGHSLACRVVATNSANSTTGNGGKVFVPARPSITITSHSVSSRRHRATFKFTTQNATATQCALAKGSAAPRYSSCVTPKTYTRLTKGSYTFFARAVGPGGASVPARHSFSIG
ncbi:MAG: choice-of-anchor Q domain-containing protein [Solirubrobacteraceae bacterium]